MNKKPEGKQFHTFSWSKINSYAFCPTLYKYRYVDRCVPKKKAVALALGSAMSHGVKKFRQTGKKNDAFKAFVDIWETEGKVLLSRKKDDPQRSVERGLEILSAYIDEYPEEPDSIVQPEVSFKIEVAPNIIFNGRIDAVVRLPDKSLAIIEDKTTSRLGPSFFVKLKGSSQVLWYLWVANEMGLFNVDGKKYMPKCWLNAIYIHHETLRFERDITIKSVRTLECAKRNMLTWINQILTAEKNNLFPLNDVDNTQCSAYGGCDYLPLKYAPDNLKSRIKTLKYFKNSCGQIIMVYSAHCYKNITDFF